MHVKILARYNCGHDPKVIVEGAYPDVKRILQNVAPDVLVDTRCGCGRWCAFVETYVDGKLIQCRAAGDFRGTGAVLGKAPDHRMN